MPAQTRASSTLFAISEKLANVRVIFSSGLVTVSGHPVGAEEVAQHRLHHARKERMTGGIFGVCRER